MKNIKLDNIIFGQDGASFSDKLKTDFNLVQGLDTRFRNKKIDSETFDFVGLVCTKEETLVVFPKHFFDIDNTSINSIGNSDKKDLISLLFKVIYKYIENTKSKADKYAGYKLNFDSDFPFSSFFSIYNYFKQFGIYKEKISKTKVGYNGKISWKKTIQKSSKYISNGNIIHFPLYVKQNSSNHVFISDCMAFAIDYTLDRFSFLFSLPKTNYNHSNINFLDNINYVIKKLQQLRNELFKDIHVRLINDLISFYQNTKNHNFGGDIHVKIKYFNLVWEEMITHYLNKHFIGIDENTKELIFDINQRESKIIFRKKTFQVDDSSNKYSIEPDHYVIDDNLQYIFDAKYYNSLKQLNYKQFSYHEILKNKRDNTISALIIPSGKINSSRIHFSLKNEFSLNGINKTTIYIQELNIKEVMESYVK